MEQEREGDVCCASHCSARMTDVFVCVFFLTGLDLAGKKNVCIRISITLGWALPQGCRLEKYALTDIWEHLCVF